MKFKLLINFIIFVLIINGCGRKEKSKGFFKNLGNKNKSKNMEVVSLRKKRVLSAAEKKYYNAQKKYFKSKEMHITSNEVYVDYTIRKGDNIWKISKRYARFLKGRSATKTDIGNISYLINKFNFARCFGGVKDNLKIGEKIYIPLESIKKAIEEGKALKD